MIGKIKLYENSQNESDKRKYPYAAIEYPRKITDGCMNIFKKSSTLLTRCPEVLFKGLRMTHIYEHGKITLAISFSNWNISRTSLSMIDVRLVNSRATLLMNS